MKICEICHEYYFEYEGSKPHKCLPVMYFKHEDWGDRWIEIRALDYEHAAMKFAEIYDSDDHYLVDGDETEVEISDGTVEKTFVVSAEVDINYYAKEEEEEDKNNEEEESKK